MLMRQHNGILPFGYGIYTCAVHVHLWFVMSIGPLLTTLITFNTKKEMIKTPDQVAQ